MFNRLNASIAWRSKRSFGVICWVITALLLSACSENKNISLAGGGSLNLNQEQIFVINYWAKWCKPCRHEIPELNRLNQHPGITVIGVDFDRHQAGELNTLVQEMNIDFPVLSGSLAPGVIHPDLSLKAKALPMTYLLESKRIDEFKDESKKRFKQDHALESGVIRAANRSWTY